MKNDEIELVENDKHHIGMDNAQVATVLADKPIVMAGRGDAAVSQRLVCALKLCWRLGLLVLGQANRTKKSRLTSIKELKI
ncbi:hypothetical protein SAMN04489724_2116 [Algoriphagus locisalis]|uniref:Uncharacterized protein n=1 Tax=Algoriphagus locisalis TaxID=305507 RepID=A0A1I7APE8_9BACT|nr:hypothetical protein SAMN04489724_2116 [Algoriphagus locisalis]